MQIVRNLPERRPANSSLCQNSAGRRAARRAPGKALRLLYEFFIGMRYTRAKRRSHFISFVSFVSVICIALGMTVLITVLSVMNGFQREIRTRILGVASHVQLSGAGGTLADWQDVARSTRRTSHSRCS